MSPSLKDSGILVKVILVFSVAFFITIALFIRTGNKINGLNNKLVEVSKLTADLSNQTKVTPTTVNTSCSTKVTSPPKRTAVDVRRSRGQSPGPFMGTGDVSELILNGDIPTAQEKFHKLLTNVTYNCREQKKFGTKPGDGGYEICVDSRYKPQKNNCLVYSFGINNDFSFDDGLNSEFQCEVHSFDPSMKTPDHKHREPNMYFHNLGLWGYDMKKDSWKLNRLQSIMKLLNHENRIIDVVKVDAEGAEWSFLVDFIQSGSFKNVRQLIMEPHTPRMGEPVTIEDYAEIYDDFEALDKAGFRRFLYHTENNCCGWFTTLVPKSISNTTLDLCCYEQFFVNTNL